MPKPASRGAIARALPLMAALTVTFPAAAQSIHALPDQTSRIRLSNRDINHIVCEGGKIEDVKFSAEKGLAVEKGGSDAWIKFLVHETDDQGQITRTFVTQPAEFYVLCNGATYPLYAEPAEIPAQTVILEPGRRQQARANTDLLGPLVEEERAVSITLALLEDRIPASFTEIAPDAAMVRLTAFPALSIRERRRLAVEGSGLDASEDLVSAAQPISIREQDLVDPALGPGIFAVTADPTRLATGETTRLVVIRRGTAR